MALFLILIYSVVMLLSVSISGYLSYEGLLRTAEEVTLPLVVMLMAIIFAMDSAISYFRQSGRPIRWLLMIWCLAAFFSISSNFNFMYSTFMRDDVTRNTLSEQIGVFRDNLVTARSKLASLDAATFAVQMRTDLNVELDNLEDQINDPLAPGCGVECRSHMERIEQILGREITNLRVPGLGSDLPVVNAWFGRYSNAATDILESSLGSTAAPTIFNLIRRIDGHMLEYDTVDRIMSTGDGLDALQDMSAISGDIERQTNALLPDDDIITLARIDPDLGRLGEIVYALHNGFVERPNLLATIFSLVIASIVDIFPLFMSFALFGKGRLERKTEVGTSRSVSGKRNVTAR